MNPHNTMNLDPGATQVSVIRIEEINMNNAQVVPIHILNHDIGSEILIPHLYLSKQTQPVVIGPEKPTKNTVKSLSAPIEHRPTIYSQFTSKSLHQTIPIASISQNQLHYKKNQQNNTIPESKRVIINEQIELPLNFTGQCLKNVFSSDGSTVTNIPNSNYIQVHSSISSSFINEGSSSLVGPSLKLQNFQPQTSTIDIEEKLVPKSNVVTKRKVQNYVHISDVKVPQRAVAVLPTALVLRGKYNIFPRRTLPTRIRFGPVEGLHTVITSSKAEELVAKAATPVFLMKKGDQIIHIDVSDKDKCNWMGLLPLAEPSAANLWLYQEEEQLYAITTEPINARKLLKLGYSRKYAEEHNIRGVPTLELETVLSSNPKQWWCNECNRALPSAPLLQRHADVYHKDDIISTRRGYRCTHCRRVFSRLFTLRRHISKYCTKRSEKSLETLTSKPDLNSTMNEDRLPSDESFQNFTNGLDFSASLFDTDRISNIDISNSRTDDFNPYDISFRDDICASNDLSFTKLAMEVKNDVVPDTKLSSRTSRKQNKRKYISDISKRLDCACGRTFRSSEKLSQHYLKEHSAENEAETKSASGSEKKNYTCDQCKTKRVSFKRRGMLVNHMWRAHRAVPAVGVERPVRHYPCVACPKVYRSKAKRDHHISVHHPGSEKLMKSTIPGGMKSYEAAVCSLCPKQYATRAKLLQHMRMAHSNTT